MWANRNYLQLQETRDEERLYFFGLIHAVSLCASILVPFAAGWFIALGGYFGWYSADRAYWILFAGVFLLMLGAAAVIARGAFKSSLTRIVIRFGAGKFSDTRRVISFAKGFMDSVFFVPTLLILYFLGSEGALGTITAAVSLFVAILLYLYGRFGGRRVQVRSLRFCGAGFIVSAILLVFLPPPANFLAYIILSAISINFFSVICEPILLSLADREMDGDMEARYSFVFDNELFLNMGRLVATGIFFILLLTFGWGSWQALIYGPLFVAIAQFFILPKRLSA